jgi:hypothetical protein
MYEGSPLVSTGFLKFCDDVGFLCQNFINSLLKHEDVASIIQSFVLRPVQMSKIAVGFYHIADTLLEFFRSGKATVALSLPDDRPVYADFEAPACRGNKRNFAKAFPKSL